LIFILRCVDEREIFGINTGIVTGIFVIIAQVFEKVNYFKVGFFPPAHFADSHNMIVNNSTEYSISLQN